MHAVGGMSLRVERNGGVATVWVSGEVDLATSPGLRDCLMDLASQRVTIDLSEVTFLDSSGLSVLVWKHAHGGMLLRGVGPAQMSVFAMTGLDEVLTFGTSI